MKKHKKEVDSQKIAEVIVQGIQEKKGKDIVSLDLRKISSSVSDYFIICHADSSTQVRAIADSVEHEMDKVLNEHLWHKQKTAYEISSRDWSSTCALPISATPRRPNGDRPRPLLTASRCPPDPPPYCDALQSYQRRQTSASGPHFSHGRTTGIDRGFRRAGRRGHRVHSHLLAHSRRPPVHGQRRPPSRATHRPPPIRRGHRPSRRRCVAHGSICDSRPALRRPPRAGPCVDGRTGQCSRQPSPDRWSNGRPARRKAPRHHRSRP